MLWSATGGLMGRLVWLGLLHASWLALAVASVIALSFRFAPRVARRTRHALLLTGLILVVVGPVGLVVRQQCVVVEIHDQGPIGPVFVVEPDGPGATTPPVAGPISERPARWSLADRSLGFLKRVPDLARAARPWGLIGWTLAVTSLGLWLALGGLGIRRLLKRSWPAPEVIQARARSLAGRLGLTVVPEVRIHPELREPCLSGPGRSAVFLPRDWLAMASEPEVVAVLAHELAHARRRDPWVNLSQRLVEVALFFHPSVRWLSKSLRIERELCTDALAVEATGDLMGLALALESVARFRLESGRNWPSRLPSLALGGDGFSLISRIQELIGMTPTRPRPAVWPFAAIPAAMILGLLATTVGSAQDPADKPAGKPAEAPTLAPIPAPAPIKHAPRVIKPEEPQIVYEVRWIKINHAMLERLTRDAGMDIPSQAAEIDTYFSVIDGKRLKSLTNPTDVEPPFDVKRVNITSLKEMKAAFVIAQKPEKANLLDRLASPGDLRLVLTGKINPDSIRVAFEAEMIVEGANAGEKRSKSTATTVTLPEDSSLVVKLDRQERKVGDQTVVEDKLVIVTPRRVILEAEEERVGGKGVKLRRATYPSPK